MNKRKLPVQLLSAKPQVEKRRGSINEDNSPALNMLDTAYIRKCAPADRRDYYKDLLKQDNVETITSRLLQAIDEELLPPVAFAPWLGVTKSAAVIREALKQDMSVMMRHLAIRHLEKELCSSNWEKIWNGLGGVEGILQIFSDLSVTEVRKACKAIGHCAKRPEPLEKRHYITELFQSLEPSIFPDTKIKTTDLRPLGQFYQLLLPSCSQELVERVISGDLSGTWNVEHDPVFLRYHSESMRREQLKRLDGDYSEHVLKNLLQQCPPVTTSEPGFSESGVFSLTILRALVESESNKIDDEFFMKELVRPLLSRAIRKRAKFVKIKEIVDLTMKYLEAHPSAGKEITEHGGNFRHSVAKCWSRKPDMFEKQLRRLCSHPVFGTSERDCFRSWQDFLINIPFRRYALIRILLQESTGLDIDQDEDLKKVKGELHPDLLYELGVKQSLPLFTRLRKLRGDEGLVGRSNVGWRGSDLYFSLPSTYHGSYGDPELCYMALQGQNGNQAEAERLAVPYIERQKKKSQSASQPEQRGFYAKSALWAAIASGSFTQLASVLEWMKRFLRDPIALKLLFIFPTKTKRLLSGIPEHFLSSLSASYLEQRVEKANSILQDLFDIACTALQEPSFYQPDWLKVFQLFGEVIEERIHLSADVKKVLNIPDDEMYHVLWEPTINMLVAVENQANQEGHERLELNHIRGIMGHYISQDQKIKPQTASVIQFFDNLAQARDGLWRTLRRSANPETEALPTSFPRGLSLQYLTSPWFLDVQNLDTFAPYLASRVKSCLFPVPTTATQPVPAHKIMQKAIGPFVDSYQRALRLYIPESCEKTEKEKRIREVWAYATKQLSQDRMSNQEAMRFWTPRLKQVLNSWQPEGYNTPKCHKWPLIPEVEDLNEPLEWNPFSSGRPDTPAKSLGKATYIDLSLLGDRDGRRTMQDLIHFPEPSVPAFEISKGLIWEQRCEGGALAAILYLDKKFRSSKKRVLDDRLITNQKDFRYPRLFLDDEFLLSDDLRARNALDSIRKQIDSVPPKLLSQLATNMMDALEAADVKSSIYSDLQQIAYLLVVALGESDKPSLASDMIIRTILDKPESSSWHRYLFKPGFLNRLSAKQACLMFQNFADEIFDRLQANEAKKSTAQNPTSTSSVTPPTNTEEVQDKTRSQPFVKITTVKLLAQLLQNSKIVPEDFSLSVLQKLFQQARHIDVRFAIVKSLLGMLDSCAVDRANDIVAALEPIVPVAGSLNERQKFTEDDWARAEESLELPELAGALNVIQSASPILVAIFDVYRYKNLNVDKLPPYVERVLLPLVTRLQQQTAMWTRLFLKKHGFNDGTKMELEIPSVPLNECFPSELLWENDDGACLVPRTLLEDYMDYIMFRINPPQPIRQLNDQLPEDPLLKSQIDVKCWLYLYNSDINSYQLPKLLDLLEVSSGQITAELVEEQFLRLFTTLVWNDGPLHKKLIPYIQGSFSERRLQAAWWEPHGKRILEKTIELIEKIRTKTWQDNSERQPPVLPDTFPWCLRLLNYPFANPSDSTDDRNKKCQNFATDIQDVIEEHMHNSSYKWLSDLKAYLALLWSWPPETQWSWQSRDDKPDSEKKTLMENRLLTATHIGALPMLGLEDLGKRHVLRVEIAKHVVEIVEHWDDLDREIKAKVEQMINMWKDGRCKSEDIRRMGYELHEKVKMGMKVDM